MTTLAHRAPATPLVRPLVVRVTVNIDFSLLFWPLFAVAWLGWLGLAGIGRAVRGAWVEVHELFRDDMGLILSAIRGIFINGFPEFTSRDWCMICEAAQLLFYRDVNYGTY